MIHAIPLKGSAILSSHCLWGILARWRGTSEPRLCSLFLRMTHGICTIRKWCKQFYFTLLCIVHIMYINKPLQQKLTYLQMFPVRWTVKPEKLNARIRAITKSFSCGLRRSIRAAVRYLYGPRRMVCRHSIGVLLLTWKQNKITWYYASFWLFPYLYMSTFSFKSGFSSSFGP